MHRHVTTEFTRFGHLVAQVHVELLVVGVVIMVLVGLGR